MNDMGIEREGSNIADEVKDHRWGGGIILFIVGLVGICGSTLVGNFMLGFGMISENQGFVLLYYLITFVFVVVMAFGAMLVNKAVKESGQGTKMVTGLIFTLIGLVGASASTLVGYQMMQSKMMQTGYGFDILFYLLTGVFIGVTLFGLYLVYTAVND